MARNNVGLPLNIDFFPSCAKGLYFDDLGVPFHRFQQRHTSLSQTPVCYP